MEAGPRNRPQQPDGRRDEAQPLTADGQDAVLPAQTSAAAQEPQEQDALDSPDPLGTSDALDGHDSPDALVDPDALPDPDALGVSDALDGSDGPDAERPDAPETAASFRDLRPPRRLRLWQLAPIVVLGAVGSLMFAFPLAFEFGGDGGAYIAMLGLLLSCCAAGWGMMAARRVGHTWPGLPPRGSGRRPDWRVVLVYTAVVLVLAALAIWRVARLR